MKKLAIVLAAGLLLTGCQKEEIDPQNTAVGSPGYNATALLGHATNGVILGTYRDLDQQTAALQSAVAALAAAPTPAALAAARARPAAMPVPPGKPPKPSPSAP